jgi:hypothetical protein
MIKIILYKKIKNYNDYLQHFLHSSIASVAIYVHIALKAAEVEANFINIYYIFWKNNTD